MRDQPETVEEIARVLKEKYGYEDCEDECHEEGVQKVAIFEKDGKPTHIAIKPSTSKYIWKSKMGLNVDMEHELHVIETLDGDDSNAHGYGKAVRFSRLKKKGASGQEAMTSRNHPFNLAASCRTAASLPPP